MLKNTSVTFINGNGSSVINNTLSLDTLANRRISLNNNAQYGRIFLPSTRLKSPPKIHCLPGTFKTKGYKKFIKMQIKIKSELDI